MGKKKPWSLKEHMEAEGEHDAQQINSAEMYDVLHVESDRGCVLVASAYIEERLREVLMARCSTLSDASHDDLKAVFKQPDSQFYNFSSCIRLARALGVIPKGIERELLDFAGVRNTFAHGKGYKPITEKFLRRFLKDPYHYEASTDNLAKYAGAQSGDDPIADRTRGIFTRWAIVTLLALGLFTESAPSQNASDPPPQ